jgi:hypothetical protein
LGADFIGIGWLCITTFLKGGEFLQKRAHLAVLGVSRLFVLLNHYSPVGFGRQHILARPVRASLS